MFWGFFDFDESSRKGFPLFILFILFSILWILFDQFWIIWFFDKFRFLLKLKNETCIIIYVLRFPSFAFEHKIKYPCSFGISFLNNWKEIVLHFQQEDVIQQHGHSQKTSKSNSPTNVWLTLLESNIEIEWSWGFWASKNWIHNRGWHVSEWPCFRLLLISIFLFLYWSLRKPLQHLKYMWSTLCLLILAWLEQLKHILGRFE